MSDNTYEGNKIPDGIAKVKIDSDYIEMRKSKQNNTDAEGFDDDQSPIRELVIKYGLTHAQANRFIGGTEEETMVNIEEFKKYNKPVVICKPRQVGKRRYSIPYGYKVEREALVKDPAEQRIIMFMMDKYNQGISIGMIADMLESLKVPTKKGGNKWYPSVISAIIKRVEVWEECEE